MEHPVVLQTVIFYKHCYQGKFLQTYPFISSHIPGPFIMKNSHPFHASQQSKNPTNPGSDIDNYQQPAWNSILPALPAIQKSHSSRKFLPQNFVSLVRFLIFIGDIRLPHNYDTVKTIEFILLQYGTRQNKYKH
jgi:hypothetical protein